jgi:hypothetical protein
LSCNPYCELFGNVADLISGIQLTCERPELIVIPLVGSV